MADEYLVFVADEDSSDRGDLSFFSSADDAAAHTESLLEAGCSQSRIRIFSSREMDVRVTQRPVVSFTSDADNNASQASEASESAPVDDDGAEGEVAGVKDGVRFSSLFKKSD